METWLKDITLAGALVTLMPLKEEHAADLVKAASDGDLWNIWYTSVPSEKTVESYIAFALSEKEQQRSLPFVVTDNETGNIIGTTRFCNATPVHRRAEIGYTFYGKSFHRTGVNAECKYLLLRHAFETLQCIAVEFRTSWHNMQSRGAIERLGAKQDGILRNHIVMLDGTFRDTVVFSILPHEWPAVKSGLLYRMKKRKTESSLL